MESRFAKIDQLANTDIKPKHIKEIKEMVRENQEGAVRLLGYCYLHGLGKVKKDKRLAKIYFKRGVKAGDIMAMFHLICMYRDDKSKDHRSKIAALSLRRVRKHKDKSENNDTVISLLISYAKETRVNPNISMTLGLIYFEGLAVTRDPVVALKYFLQLKSNPRVAQQYRSDVYYYLGKCYQETKNNKLAFTYLSLAAKMRHEKAILSLGDLHLAGAGTEKNVSKAGECYLDAAKVSNEEVSKLAFAKLEILAEQENFDTDILNKLALCYRYGFGVEKKLPKSIQLCEKILQIVADEINDDSLQSTDLIDSYKNTFKWLAAIIEMDIELLEARRMQLRQEEFRDEAHIAQISLVIRGMNALIKLKTDDKVFQELREQKINVPEVRHIAQVFCAQEAARLFAMELQNISRNMWEQIQKSNFKVRFLGVWIKGTPDHIPQLKELLKKASSVDVKEAFIEYCKIINFLTKILPSRRRHPDTTFLYQQALATFQNISVPLPKAELMSEKLLEAKDAGEKEVPNYLDLNYTSELQTPILPMSIPPMFSSSYLRLGALLPTAPTLDNQSLPPAYQEPSAPPQPPKLTIGEMHERRVSQQLATCYVPQDEPLVSTQGVFAQQVVVPAVSRSESEPLRKLTAA